MNSEFPMTFQDDSQAGKSKSRKSNIIPLSRISDVGSEVSSSRTQKDDFPLSQFGEEEHVTPAGKKSPMRYLVRGFLLTVLAGLWIAIGTGRLTSDSDEIEAIRSLISGVESNESSETAPGELSEAQTASLNGNNLQEQSHSAVQASNATAPVTGDAAEGKSPSLPSQNAQQPQENGQVKANLDLPQTLPQQLAYQTAQTAQSETTVKDTSAAVAGKVPPVPAPAEDLNMSDSDVKKTARFLKQQQKQLLEMEEHLTSMIARFGESELADQQLKELEEQHRQAAAKLKERRAKLRQ